MRDKLVHAYFGIDKKRIWITATSEVPILLKRFEGLLKDLRKNLED